MSHSLSSIDAWNFDPPLWRRLWWATSMAAVALLFLLGAGMMVWGWLSARSGVQLAGSTILVAGVAIQTVTILRTMLLARRERLGEE